MHRRAIALVGAVAMALTALTACAPERAIDFAAPAQVDAEIPEATLSELQGAVTAAMTATGSSGAIVGVWVPWSGTWVAGLGTQKPGDDREVSADMTFRVGDVTRAMTCDALYEAVAAGTVKLEDSVTTYVSGVPDLKDVTLEQLCDGTAGIGSYQARLQSMWLGNPERVWNPRELASIGLGQARTTAPGAKWRDSDAGYILLGLALEHAERKNASELLADSVFGPLGLESTSLHRGRTPWTSGVKALHGTVALKGSNGAYNCAEPLDATDVSTSTGFTDSGVVSTITDLGRYTQALALGALAGDDAAAKSRWESPQMINTTTWLTTAGGAFQAGSLVGQYGAVPGYLTAAFADPATGLTVAVVLNNSAAGASVPAHLAWELAAIASKAPAAEGQTAPEFGLPWTAEQHHTAIQKAAVCTAPAS